MASRPQPSTAKFPAASLSGGSVQCTPDEAVEGVKKKCNLGPVTSSGPRKSPGRLQHLHRRRWEPGLSPETHCTHSPCPPLRTISLPSITVPQSRQRLAAWCSSGTPLVLAMQAELARNCGSSLTARQGMMQVLKCPTPVNLYAWSSFSHARTSPHLSPVQPRPAAGPPLGHQSGRQRMRLPALLSTGASSPRSEQAVGRAGRRPAAPPGGLLGGHGPGAGARAAMRAGGRRRRCAGAAAAGAAGRPPPGARACRAAPAPPAPARARGRILRCSARTRALEPRAAVAGAWAHVPICARLLGVWQDERRADQRQPACIARPG